MSDHPSRRFRRPSLRALLALGGAAAVVVSGAIATTDTLAASTDEANAQVSQIATQNFFPTPLPATITCSNSGVWGSRSANISWTSAGPGHSYRVNVMKGNTSRQEDYLEGTSIRIKIGNVGDTLTTLWVQVRTLNAASSANPADRVASSGFVRFPIYAGSIADTYCNGSADYSSPNQTWENAGSWEPQSPQLLARRGPAGRALSPETTTAPSEVPDESAEPLTTSTPSEPPALAEPEATDVPTTPSSTEQPAPSSTEPAEDDTEVTIGIGVAGDKKALIVSRDGEEVCHTPLEPGDQPSINGNTVVIQSGDTVKTVDTTTCAVS
ncbi:hypothetical protein [Gordonia caeni]|uniref:Fibronectin type-III domain-containing protein n=1 Tax=Gordonia caeni TaxID=1007097 RepID=A0ABP7NNF5_9ACTN